MLQKAENPCAGAAGVSEVMKSGKDLKHPESKSPLITTQALHLSRRCAISVAMAAIIAPLAFGERA